jgi:hypothetical protein
VSEDGAVGAVIGIGIGAAVLLLLTRRAHAMTTGSPRGSAREQSPRAPIYGPRLSLVERWRPEIEKRAGDLPVEAILEWIQIESGGDTCSPGMSTEAGIFQLNFPDDAKYGASLKGLQAICAKSKLPGFDISWLSEAELDMEVGSGIRKIRAARDIVRQVFAANGMSWSEGSFDFGSAIKQIHSAPAVILELVPKIVHRDGTAPTSWNDLRSRVMAFPVDQMSGLDAHGRPYGLRALALAPSKYGLRNRLEDTMRNAEFVGLAWKAPRSLTEYA